MIHNLLLDKPLHLNASEVHVWHISLRPPESRLAELRASLSPDERARAERFASERLAYVLS